jgi:hypothetical protein
MTNGVPDLVDGHARFEQLRSGIASQVVQLQVPYVRAVTRREPELA